VPKEIRAIPILAAITNGGGLNSTQSWMLKDTKALRALEEFAAQVETQNTSM
jgi:hypothetical protein